MEREDFEAAWSRWDKNGNGVLDFSEVDDIAPEIAELIGDPTLSDPTLLYHFVVQFYDDDFNGLVEKDELWRLLQEAAEHKSQ